MRNSKAAHVAEEKSALRTEVGGEVSEIRKPRSPRTLTVMARMLVLLWVSTNHIGNPLILKLKRERSVSFSYLQELLPPPLPLWSPSASLLHSWLCQEWVQVASMALHIQLSSSTTVMPPMG